MTSRFFHLQSFGIQIIVDFEKLLNVELVEDYSVPCGLKNIKMTIKSFDDKFEHNFEFDSVETAKYQFELIQKAFEKYKLSQ